MAGPAVRDGALDRAVDCPRRAVPGRPRRLDDPAAIVRATAVRALAQLLDRPAFTRLRTRHLDRERDPAISRSMAAMTDDTGPRRIVDTCSVGGC